MSPNQKKLTAVVRTTGEFNTTLCLRGWPRHATMVRHGMITIQQRRLLHRLCVLFMFNLLSRFYTDDPLYGKIVHFK
jgi:hypothetical protein